MALLTFIGAGYSFFGGRTISLFDYIGGANGSWSQANLELVRRAALAAMTSAASTTEKGATVCSFGRVTECYNLVNGFDQDVYTTIALPYKKSLVNADKNLSLAYSLSPYALTELSQLGCPRPQLVYLTRFLTSDSLRYRVSAVGTLLTLAATLNLHP